MKINPKNLLTFKFTKEKNCLFNTICNAIFYLSLAFNFTAYVLFATTQYPYGFLAVFSKLFTLLPLILIYLTPILFKLDSNIRSFLYWLFLTTLSCHNFFYYFYNTHYVGFLAVILIILYISDYIFATHKEIILLSPLRAIPYWYYEKKILLSIAYFVITTICVSLLWWTCCTFDVELQLVILCIFIIHFIFVIFNIPSVKVEKRFLTFSRAKLLIFFKQFKMKLFDLRLSLLFLVALIKNFPFFILVLFGASGYLDHFYVFNSFLLVILIITLIVSFPESQMWNNIVLKKRGFRLLGWNILRSMLFNIKKSTLVGGSAIFVTAVGMSVNDHIQTRLALNEEQKEYDCEKDRIEKERDTQLKSCSITSDHATQAEKRYQASLDSLDERPRLKDIKPYSTAAEINKNVRSLMKLDDFLGQNGESSNPKSKEK